MTRRLLATAVMGVLIWWAMRTVSIQSLSALVKTLSPQALFIFFAINSLLFALFPLRWWIFLRALGYRIPYRGLIAYRLTAFGVSYFTPGPHFGGEPYQIWILMHRHAVPLERATTSVTLDKVLESLFNFLFLLAGAVVVVALLALDVDLERRLLVSALFLVLIPLSLVLLYAAGLRPITAVLTRINNAQFVWLGRFFRRSGAARWIPTVCAIEKETVGLCRRKPRAVVAATALTILTWAGMIAEFWFMTTLLDLHLTALQAATLLFAARVAILLPMPAGLGTLEAGQVYAATLLGLDPAVGIGMSLLIRLRDVTFGTIGLWLGGAVAWRPAPAASVHLTGAEPLDTVVTPVPDTISASNSNP